VASDSATFSRVVTDRLSRDKRYTSCFAYSMTHLCVDKKINIKKAPFQGLF
jgi:hypothetical protein